MFLVIYQFHMISLFQLFLIFTQFLLNVHRYVYLQKIIESQLNTWRHSISGCQLWSSNLKTSIETQSLFLWVQYNWVKFENHGEEREYVLILKRALKLCMRWTRLCVIDQKVCGLSKTFFPPTTMNKKIPKFLSEKYQIRG